MGFNGRTAIRLANKAAKNSTHTIWIIYTSKNYQRHSQSWQTQRKISSVTHISIKFHRLLKDNDFIRFLLRKHVSFKIFLYLRILWNLIDHNNIFRSSKQREKIYILSNISTVSTSSGNLIKVWLLSKHDNIPHLGNQANHVLLTKLHCNNSRIKRS